MTARIPTLTTWLALASFIAACGGGEEVAPGESDAATTGPTTGAPPTAVRVETPRIEIVPDTLEVTGQLVAESETALAFKVPGYVDEVRVDAGDEVRAGEVLATLRDDEVEARVAAVEADVTRAQRLVERFERLHADSVVALADLQNAQDGLRQTEAALRAARFDLDNARILAPADGRVLQRLVEPAQWANPGAPVLSFGSTSGGWRIRVALSDREVVRIHLGTAADVVLDALPDLSLRAVVVEVAAGPTPGTGLYPVELRLEAPPVGIRSGFVGRVRLSTEGPVARLRLRPESIADIDDGVGIVYVIDAVSIARERRVRLRGFAGEDVLASGDVAADDQLVTTGAAFLREGDDVQVVGGEGDR